MVLATGLFLIVMLSVFLAGLGRQATVSLALANGARDHDRAFQAAEDALSQASAAVQFRRQPAGPSITRPAPATEVHTALDYLGETDAIPHPAWQPTRDAALVAHHFRLRVAATRRAAHVALERDFAVVAPRGIPGNAALLADPTPANAPFGGAVIIGPWRILP